MPAQSQNTFAYHNRGGNPLLAMLLPPTAGSIAGTLVDKDGAAIPNAKVGLTEGPIPCAVRLGQ